MITIPQTTPIVEMKHRKDLYFLIGYGLIILSFATFTFIEFTELDGRQDHFTLFILHYLLAIVYAVLLISDRSFGIRRSWKKENLGKTVVLIELLLISAYALNREIPVFNDSTTWLCIYLLITSIALLSFQYFEQLPSWLNRIQYFIIGSALIFYVYLIAYVGEYFPIGAIGMLFFGIGGHIFVPVLLLVVSGFIIYHSQNKTISYGWIIAGFVSTLLYTLAFVYTWSERIEKIESMANHAVLEESPELPVWVTIGQSLRNDWITERILKSDLVYQTSNESNNRSFLPETTSWEEKKKHDPFVFLSSLKSRVLLPAEDRVRILNAISDQRHRSNERLWSGDNLTTSHIISDVDIYPNLRISYIEKYLTVRNNAKQNRWWGNTQEAIYTFELPEGSVITSLSLWINGKEEKGIMTSKQKATKAYKEIVGVERRDPSVVHWQEGNTVTVRVFPCTTQEERKFKIGITSPLEQHNGNLLYRNTVFLGPNASNANEILRFRVLGDDHSLPFDSDFKKDSKGFFTREANYDPDFALEIPTVPVKKDNRFIFQDHAYSIADLKPSFEKVSFKKIYLDVNNSWTTKELDILKEWIIAGKKLYMFDQQELIELKEDNWDKLLEQQHWNFSLFPFHLVKDTDHALIITKGKSLSPHLSDFKESGFAKGIGNFFLSDKKIAVYNLGNQSSTYINSLRELRAFRYAQGEPGQLEKWLKENIYPKAIENDEQVVLHQAGLIISKKPRTGELTSNAPDHLARLFAYNDILRQVGTNYFNEDFVNESLVNEATTAYVVSPVSSLIVLESEADYKRFDIEENSEGLKNASKESSGAVPEPHEWVLIILFALFILFIGIKKVRA